MFLVRPVSRDSASEIDPVADVKPRIEVAEHGRPWSFDGNGYLFRLVSEAHRIRLAHLFDPVLAVHTSVVEKLPHQITAVYEAMLPRQPLRFLLADDPGAGKTIMAGLFIKELIARGDLQRCLVVCPGSLAEQWQDEPDRGLMALAGLWENWPSPAGEWVRSFTIITTTPNDLCAELHNRMPVVLGRHVWPEWLGEEPADLSRLKPLLEPYPA
jgi:hypothetical protein